MFTGDVPARATGSGSTRHWIFGMGAAALNHEVFDHTMEVQTVVVAHVDQFDKIRHGVGGAAMIKFDCDVSCAGLHECVHATPR